MFSSEEYCGARGIRNSTNATKFSATALQAYGTSVWWPPTPKYQ